MPKTSKRPAPAAAELMPGALLEGSVLGGMAARTVGSMPSPSQPWRQGATTTEASAAAEAHSTLPPAAVPLFRPMAGAAKGRTPPAPTLSSVGGDAILSAAAAAAVAAAEATPTGKAPAKARSAKRKLNLAAGSAASSKAASPKSKK
eukprot:gene27543-19002_t